MAAVVLNAVKPYGGDAVDVLLMDGVIAAIGPEVANHPGAAGAIQPHELGIRCEDCHGPAAAHASRPVLLVGSSPLRRIERC